MPKKIAVLVTDRQAEALRMAIGLSLKDDEVHVYLMNRDIDLSVPDIAANIAMLRELGVPIISSFSAEDNETLSTDAIAFSLVHFDTVIPY